MKTLNLVIRMSETDKAALRKLAESKQMTMSEFVTYLIRREADKMSIK